MTISSSGYWNITPDKLHEFPKSRGVACGRVNLVVFVLTLCTIPKSYYLSTVLQYSFQVGAVTSNLFILWESVGNGNLKSYK